MARTHAVTRPPPQRSEESQPPRFDSDQQRCVLRRIASSARPEAARVAVIHRLVRERSDPILLPLTLTNVRHSSLSNLRPAHGRHAYARFRRLRDKVTLLQAAEVHRGQATARIFSTKAQTFVLVDANARASPSFDDPAQTHSEAGFKLCC